MALQLADLQVPYNHSFRLTSRLFGADLTHSAGWFPRMVGFVTNEQRLGFSFKKIWASYI